LYTVVSHIARVDAALNEVVFFAGRTLAIAGELASTQADL